MIWRYLGEGEDLGEEAGNKRESEGGENRGGRRERERWERGAKGRGEGQTVMQRVLIYCNILYYFFIIYITMHKQCLLRTIVLEIIYI